MAQSVIGALRVNLGLNSAQFQNGLRGAQSRLRRFAAFAKGALIGAAVAATAGVAILTKSALSFVDQQAKVARTIDGSIDGLRALQMAAGDAGVAQSDLNKSMQMIGARLAEAEVKGGASADALERLGLSAKELSKLDADERLAVMADRVNELGLSSGQATQFLMDMGVRSKEMALLLTQGGDAIRAARHEVNELGLSLSAVDAAKVEAANDAMSRIGGATEALGNRLAIFFAPLLETIAVGFTNSMRAGGLFRSFLEVTGNVLSYFMSLVSDVAVIFGSLWRAIADGSGATATLQSVASAISFITGPLVAVVQGARDAIGFMASLIRVTGGFGEAMAALAPVAIEVWRRIGDGADYVRAAIAVMVSRMTEIFYTGLAKLTQAWVEFTWKIANGLNNLFKTNLQGASDGLASGLFRAGQAAATAGNAAQEAMRRAAASFKAPLASLAKLRGLVNETTQEATSGLNETAEAATNLDQSLGGGGGSGGGSAGGGGVAAKVDDIKTSVERLNEKLGETKTAMAAAFTSMITGAKSVKDALSELLGKFAEMAASSVFNSLWGRAVSAISGTGFGSFIGGALSSNIASTMPSVSKSGGLRGNIKLDPISLGRTASRMPQASKGQQLVGGSLTIGDNGEVMARMQVVAQGATGQGLKAYDAGSAIRTRDDLRNPRIRKSG